MAPELLQNVKYTEKSDVYSYGVLLWEIASREEPFTEVEMKCLIPMQVLMGTLKLEIPEEVPKAYGDINISCCDVNPDKRPHIQEIVSQLSQMIKAEKKKVAKQPTMALDKPSKSTSGELSQLTSGYLIKSTRPPSQGGFLDSIFASTQRIEIAESQKTEQLKLEQAKANEAATTEQLRVEFAKLELAKESAKAEQLKLELEKAKEAAKTEQLRLELAKETAREKAEQAKKEATAQSERVGKERRDQIEALAFGGEKWKTTFGYPGPVPPLPENIDQILLDSCPFWKGKRVQETHLLVLIPAIIDGKSLTLNRLGKLIKHPKRGYATKYRNIHDKIVKKYGDKQLDGGSYWVLMTGDVIEGTRGKSFKEQQELLKTLGKGLYQVPTLLEAAAGILTEYTVSGIRLYSEDSPQTYTRCQEVVSDWQTCVGGFSAAGLFVISGNGDYSMVGVASVRKL